MFYFQAEDGIRDLVRSRGLGDVYKRQGEDVPVYATGAGAAAFRGSLEQHVLFHLMLQSTPASYTHLTLPTSDLV